MEYIMFNGVKNLQIIFLHEIVICNVPQQR
jgi:hypothetical protein